MFLCLKFLILKFFTKQIGVYQRLPEMKLIKMYYYLKTIYRLDFSLFALTPKYEDNFWEGKVNLKEQKYH